jgi:NADH:ubiquinone oxidoreductase subunit 3 (subunit A)
MPCFRLVSDGGNGNGAGGVNIVGIVVGVVVAAAVLIVVIVLIGLKKRSAARVSRKGYEVGRGFAGGERERFRVIRCSGS